MIDDKDLLVQIDNQLDAFSEKWHSTIRDEDDESMLFTKLQRFSRDLRWALEEIEWKKVRTFHR